MILSRKGADSGWPFLQGAIVMIVIMFFVAVPIYKAFAEENKAKKDFDALVQGIQALKDGGSYPDPVKPYRLPKDYLLVSFNNGKDFEGSENCNEKVKVPEVCGDTTCLCLCEESSFGIGMVSESCTKRAVSCATFKKEDYDTVTDVACQSGLFREGPKGGVINFQVKKEGKVLRFCDNGNCFSEEQAKAVKWFDSFVSTYKTCLALKTTPCACSLDFSFLGEQAWQYGLIFYTDKIDLWDKFPGSSHTLTITRNTFTTNADASLTEYLQEYNKEITDPVLLVKVPKDNPSLIPSFEERDTSLLSAKKSYIEVSNSLLFNGGKMFFVDPSYNFDGIYSCKTGQLLEQSSSESVQRTSGNSLFSENSVP